ncbi:MAG: hypothetical protein EPO40_18875 [Myxococcaceae bacterium]|nr:MAG: hypothetical protein EPO40_18875 [Myxococcaceae bacterium]
MFQDSLLHPRPAWLPAAFGVLVRHRFVTAAQLAARLHIDLVEAVVTLDALVEEGLLQAVSPSSNLRGDPVPRAYLLTRSGCDLYATATGDDRPPTVDPRRSLAILEHELGIVTFALVLELLTQQGQLQLHRFETARTKIADVAHVAESGRPRRIPLVADALAVVEVQGEVRALLIENDRGTVPVERMAMKYLGYIHWHRASGPLRRFGLKNFRVLTITPNAKRLERLREAATETAGSSRFFWFAEAGEIRLEDPKRLLGLIWSVAGHDGALRLPLFPS